MQVNKDIATLQNIKKKKKRIEKDPCDYYGHFISFKALLLYSDSNENFFS